MWTLPNFYWAHSSDKNSKKELKQTNITKEAKTQRDLKMNIRWSPCYFDGLRKSGENQKKVLQQIMRKWEWEWEEDEARMRNEKSKRERRGLRERIESEIWKWRERKKKRWDTWREIIDFVFEFFYEVPKSWEHDT